MKNQQLINNDIDCDNSEMIKIPTHYLLFKIKQKSTVNMFSKTMILTVTIVKWWEYLHPIFII